MYAICQDCGVLPSDYLRRSALDMVVDATVRSRSIEYHEQTRPLLPGAPRRRSNKWIQDQKKKQAKAFEMRDALIARAQQHGA